MSGSTKHPAGEKYPRGKLNADDEGQLAMRVGNDGMTVRLDFGKPVAWVGLSGDDAAALAAVLIRHAKQVGITKPLEIQL